jgi:carbon-monoxide dehydrogenase large subunit
MKDGTAQPGAWIGRAMPRREDARLLAGQGRFVADLAPPGCLHLAFLRSPYGAGRITLLDTADAAAMPGVALVLTSADLALMGQAAVNPLLPGAAPLPLQPLADGVVRAAGQAVAAVVADTPFAARDAADMVALEVDGDAHAIPPALCQTFGTDGPLPDLPTATVTLNHALVAPMALEPRAVLAMPEGDGISIWLSVQTPQRCRDDLAAILGLPRDAVRVVAPDVGGAFGGKASLMPEDVVVAVAALRTGRPVLWQGARGEEFLAATQGRGAATRATVAFAPDGRIRALRAQMEFPLGHWMPYSALAPARNGGRVMPGPYAVADTSVAVTAQASEGAAVNIYRGAGRPEAVMLMERAMDRAAGALGIDPLEMRRRNLSGPGPRACSGDPAALLDRVAHEADYSALRQRQAARRAAGGVCGIGIGLYVEPCGQGWEYAGMRLLPNGTILALTGSSAQGQGRETAVAQIVAETLGLSPDRIQVAAGDTALVPDGIGALASRSTPIGGSAMLRAARAFADLAAATAARLLNCAPDEVILSDAGPAPGLAWADLAARADAPLAIDLRHEATAEAWASGAVLAEVGIDPDTGAVTVERITWIDDAGRVINPMLVQGQLIGGLAQGLGATLMERMVYRDGQLLTGSLMDYAVPRASDMPPVRLISQPTLTPANPLGAKGVGEAGCIGVPAALLNAVQDALIPFDAPDLTLPLTSEKVWRAINRLPQDAP